MRIAVVHSFYSSRVPSGENQVVKAQVEALADAGHEVWLVSRSTDDRLRRRTYAVEAALTTVTGVGPDPTAELEAFAPDVVHVHNLFPNFGTRWLAAWPGRLVATVHNFRPMCAGAYLFRDGAPCRECPDGDPWAGVRHGCYHGSAVATLPLAWRGRGGAPHDPLMARADTVITLSPRAREVYAEAGVPHDRLRVLPNFVAVPRPTVPAQRGPERWLCVARLTPEKGVLDLVRTWPAGRALDVVGEGEQRDAIIGAAPPGVRLLGSLANDDLRARMPGYTGLVVPSRWFEGLPTVYLEALAAGLPVVATAGNSAADDVAEHALGRTVPAEPADGELAAALDDVRRGGEGLRARVRESFAARYTPETWVRGVIELYRPTAAPVAS